MLPQPLQALPQIGTIGGQPSKCIITCVCWLPLHVWSAILQEALPSEELLRTVATCWIACGLFSPSDSTVAKMIGIAFIGRRQEVNEPAICQWRDLLNAYFLHLRPAGVLKVGLVRVFPASAEVWRKTHPCEYFRAFASGGACHHGFVRRRRRYS